LSRRLGDRQSQLDMLECRHDLLDRESLLLHGNPLRPQPGVGLPKSSPSEWSEFAVADHRR
jgi:hypothetical protein